ncbi:MAG: PA2169 family four-helix-bundle protein [Bacteroidetes bacterium]|nr:PA2169 family four-helix-bundle protein [Bacteroidota bacterium]
METITKEKSEKLIAQLNDLVEINNDRIKGYERAISETDDEDLTYLFTNMAAHSKAYKNDLSREIILLGGEPTESTKVSGKLFRAWMDIKSALTGKNRKEILGSCEFGENAALDTYKKIISDEENILTDNLSKLIHLQKKEIQLDHDRVKALRELGKNL